MSLTDDLWKKITATLLAYLVVKNQHIWKAVWAALAAHSWLNGYIKVHRDEEGFIPPRLDDVLNLRHSEARRYFEDHGMEFVKTMTDTDLARLKQQISFNWGVSEDKFVNIIRGSYLCSDARLMAIYRTESHIAEAEAGRRAAARIGARMKRWRIRDGNACSACQDMDGEVTRLDEEYSCGTMTAHLHPSCRCFDEYF
jgi:hypothetical protein